ncbi:BREX-3 system phosphatase PglZ [Acidocella sp. KAb 2-4]|uniref:BREX-3 system phosphatase PglZ n=1 Tax=Acidocella sp. KAb 2-4 TaxID=2885158 RepID=UPI001D091118|nr:BREX-3 system phosphatase PglZ [Acidocella sp. KAb 2-4]MCB5945339.1 BREX-3 system phosphatase PglZ [Acidocella sp. KAb 2-4]
MNQWHQRILGSFTADLSRLWVACDPDGVLLDEKLLSELRARGFEVMGYDDPFRFRAEYEERYRTAWDANEQAPSPALIVHLRHDNANDLPWDIVHNARPAVRLNLAELFPRLAYGAVRQVEPERLGSLFDAHQTELQSARGESESKDFILEHVYQLAPRSIRTPVDFWRETLRLHFAGRALPEPFAEHVATILHGRGLLVGHPVSEWLSSRNALLRVVQDAWYRNLEKLKLDGRHVPELHAPADGAGETGTEIEIPFDHTDVHAIIDSMFLDGSLHPLTVSTVPTTMPGWIKAGVVADKSSQFALAAKSIEALAAAVPEADSSHKQWSDFAKRFGEMLSRVHDLPGKDAGERMTAVSARIKEIQALADERLQAWVIAGHYADLILQPSIKGPVMVHHVPRFLRQRRSAGEARVALLVFDGLAFDQWVRIREHLIAAQQPFAFDENTAFAWLPTVTSVSRQALFSGLRPREFDDSIDHTNKEETLWKAFWQNEGGIASGEVMYRRALHQVEQLDALEADIASRKPTVLGLVIDEVDERLHKERSKEDVALWIGRWLGSGFVERLFAFLLSEGFSIYVTADHGNVDAVGIGRPNQGVIAETRGERVRVYRSDPLRAESAVAYPGTAALDIAGLPANFKPLFAGGRTAFVPNGDQVVVHGGVSVEELVVPFVRVSDVNGAG